MIAKLRVGWMVAGCAPGVRTITRSIRFHCTTGLTGCGAESPGVWSTASNEAPFDPMACAERLAHRSASATKVLVIDNHLLSLVSARAAELNPWHFVMLVRPCAYIGLGFEGNIPWAV